jgi:hypothetical protein
VEKKSHLTRIILYQNLGFLAVIVFCFLDELLKLPKLIFSDHPFTFVYRRPTLEMLLFLAVGEQVNAPIVEAGSAVGKLPAGVCLVPAH